MIYHSLSQSSVLLAQNTRPLLPQAGVLHHSICSTSKILLAAPDKTVQRSSSTGYYYPHPQAPSIADTTPALILYPDPRGLSKYCCTCGITTTFVAKTYWTEDMYSPACNFRRAQISTASYHLPIQPSNTLKIFEALLPLL
jgi:hypothetical protein